MQRLPSRLAALALTLSILCLSAASPAPAAEVVDRIVAVVNGQIVTLFELNGNLKPFLERFRGKQLSDDEKRAIAGMRKQLLDKMVEDILITQEVTKMKLTTTDVEVENAVDNFRKKNGLTKDDFDKQLKLEGLTREEFSESIRKDILKHRLLGFMVRRKVVVSDEEARAFYDAHSGDFTSDKTVALSAILLPSGQDGAALRRRIEKGEIGFADAANLYSKGPGVGQGGSLGTLAWADLAEDWRLALSGVPRGGITEPFPFRDFTALLRVDELQAGDVRPFEDVKDEIIDRLFQKQVEERYDEFMDKLRSEAVIEIKL